MNVTKSDITSFKHLYMKYFNEDIDDESACRQLLVLLNLMKATYRPISQSQLSKLVERDLQQLDKEL